MALGKSNIILIGCAVATAGVIYLGSQKGSAASYHDDSAAAGATTTPIEPTKTTASALAPTRTPTPGASTTPTAIILTLGQVRNLPRPTVATSPVYPFIPANSGGTPAPLDTGSSTPTPAPAIPANETPPSEAAPSSSATPVTTPVPAATPPWMATPPALPADWPAPENPFHAPPPHE